MDRIQSLDKRLVKLVRRIPRRDRWRVLQAIGVAIIDGFPQLPDYYKQAVEKLPAIDDALRKVIEENAAKLDDAYLNLLDADKESDLEFRISRAAAAIAYALSSTGFEDCIYESSFAFDAEKLESIITRITS